MDQWLKYLHNFYQWTDRTEVSNGGILVLAVLLALFALGFLALIFAVAEDEKRWEEEKKALIAALQCRCPEVKVTDASQIRAGGNLPNNVPHREKTAMSHIAEAKQMVKEIGLLRALMMVSLVAILGKMLKTSWDQIKHHFEEAGEG